MAGLRQSGHEWFIPRGLLARATLHRLTSNPAAAREHLEKARAIVHETGYDRRDHEVAWLSLKCGVA